VAGRGQVREKVRWYVPRVDIDHPLHPSCSVGRPVVEQPVAQMLVRKQVLSQGVVAERGRALVDAVGLCDVLQRHATQREAHAGRVHLGGGASRRRGHGRRCPLYCKKSTVFASADGTDPKGTIASECPKSPHCKRSSGTGIWRECSAWTHTVRNASSSTCTVLNTPRSDKAPRMRRHAAAKTAQPQDAESVKVGGHSGIGLTEREKSTDGGPLRNLDPRQLHPWRRRGQIEEGRIAHRRPRNEAPGRGYHC